jgi:vacuolar protein sorting-associated protein VTA1
LKNGETPIPGPLDGADSEDTQEGSTIAPSGAPPPIDINPYTNPTPFQNTDGEQPYTAPVVKPTPVLPPVQQFQHMNVQPTPSEGSVKLSVEQITKAQKYCKYAISSLDYEDMATAVSNLQKALHLCQTGQELQ